MNLEQNTSQPSATNKLGMILNSHPPKRMAFIFQAVILSLFAHIFVLAVMYLATASPASADHDEKPVIEEMELKFEEEEPEESQQSSGPMSEEVQNLLANASSERTNDKVNYSGMTKAQIEQQVLNELKSLEQSEYDKLKTTHQDFSVKDKNDGNKDAKDNKESAKDNYDWYKNQSTKSYSGPVSAEYNLAGRNAKSTPKPTYRCKASGKVVVKIQVDPSGAVTDAEVDEAKTTGIDCIREESLSYAKRWKFDYKGDAAKKQNGTITFTFSSQ